MKKRKLIVISVLVSLALLLYNGLGCEQEDFWSSYDCDDCLDSKPDSADLIVYVTVNEENSYVPLVFYKGNIEDNVVDWIDTSYDEEFFLFSEVGIKYSVVARYKRGNDTILAIDADRIRIINAEADCYSPCYLIRSGTLDVRLK